MSKKITLNESDLKKMVNETVKRVINEFYGTFDDTTSAPWNQDYDGTTSDEVDYWDEYYVDLTSFIEENPQLKKLLSPMVDNPEDGWSYCKLGPVEIHFDVESSDYEQDEEGYIFANNTEIVEDSVEVYLDRKRNKYAQLLPDKLIGMLEAYATKDFHQYYSVSDLEF